MITLHGTGYYKNLNFIIGRCPQCTDIAIGILSNETTMSCQCSKETITKPPLYYLKSQKCPMIIYRLTHVPTQRNFIGVIVTNESRKIDEKIVEEIRYLRDFREYKISPELKKLLKNEDDFTHELLSTPDTMVKGMIDEKLFIGKYKAAHPNGFNQVPYLETIIKRTKR